MTLVETGRDFLFARKRKPHVTPPTGISPAHKTPISPPELHGDENLRSTRRTAIKGAAIVATGLALGALTLRPWRLIPTFTEFDGEPENLESLVAQAKQMEKNYNGRDISNKPAREKYASLLAGIFTFHFPGYLTRKQLIASLVWTDSLDEYIRLRTADYRPPLSRQELLQQRQIHRFTNAHTDNRKRKITVNGPAESFKQENINLARPKGWNPLTELQHVLFHEFGHLVTEDTDDIIFSILDPENKLSNKKVEGFRITGDVPGGFEQVYNFVHEATVELQSREISATHFGNFYNSRYIEDEVDVGLVVGRLKRVLKAAKISNEELNYFHKNSKLREFLLLLMERQGIGEDVDLKERITKGLTLMTAIEVGNGNIIQEYIDAAGKIYQ